MSDISTGSIESLNVGEIRKDINTVSEEAIKRVQEQAKQAKYVQQEIKKDKDINTRLANFLAYILKNIPQETLTQKLYNVFFVVTHPQSGIVYMKKSVNSKVIVGLFVPFYPEKAKYYKVWHMYESIVPNNISTISDLIQYLQKLSKLYHDNIPLDKEKLVDFLTEYVLIYLPDVYATQNLSEKRYMIHLELAKYLYTK